MIARDHSVLSTCLQQAPPAARGLAGDTWRCPTCHQWWRRARSALGMPVWERIPWWRAWLRS